MDINSSLHSLNDECDKIEMCDRSDENLVTIKEELEDSVSQNQIPIDETEINTNSLIHSSVRANQANVNISLHSLNVECDTNGIGFRSEDNLVLIKEEFEDSISQNHAHIDEVKVNTNSLIHSSITTNQAESLNFVSVNLPKVEFLPETALSDLPLCEKYSEVADNCSMKEDTAPITNLVPNVEFKTNEDLISYNTQPQSSSSEVFKSEENRSSDHMVIYEGFNEFQILRRLLEQDPLTCSVPKSSEEKERSVRSGFKCDHCSKEFSKENCVIYHKLTTHRALYPSMNNLTSFRHNCEDCFKNRSSNKLKFQVLFSPSVGTPSVKTVTLLKNNSIKAQNITCLVCKKSFKNKVDVNAHLSSHYEHYKCDVCSREFKTKRSIRNHLKTHKETQLKTTRCFECVHCRKKFKTQDTLDWHMSCHAKSHDCEICFSKFKTLSEFNVHLKVHPEIKWFQCSFCSSKFRTNQHLTEHMNSLKNYKSHQLPESSSKFKSEMTLRKRRMVDDKQKQSKKNAPEMTWKKRRMVDNKQKQSVKIEWEKTLIKWRIVDEKQKQSEKNEREITLKKPTMVYNEEEQPCRFKKVNDETWPYQCFLCSLKFKTGDSLAQHYYKTHYNTSRFKCSVCSQEFSKKNIFNKHIKTCSRKKLFLCSLCPFECDKDFLFERHIKKFHDGIQSYNCRFCPSKFKAMVELKAHVVCHEQVEVQENFPLVKDEILEHSTSNDPLAVKGETSADSNYQVEITSPSNNSQIKSSSLNSIQNKTLPLKSVQKETSSLNNIHNETSPLNNIQNETLPLKSVQKKTSPIDNTQNETSPLDTTQNKTTPFSSIQNRTSALITTQNETTSFTSTQNKTLPLSRIQNGTSLLNNMQNDKTVNNSKDKKVVRIMLNKSCEDGKALARRNEDHCKYYQCTVCFLILKTTIQGLINHLSAHKKTEPHKCPICCAKLCSKLTLLRHVNTHEAKPYRCFQCSLKFKTKENLLSHKLCHKKIDLYVCHICNLKFKSLSELNVHFERHNDTPKQFLCPQRPSNFRTENDLKVHMKSHSLNETNKIKECTVRLVKFESTDSFKKAGRWYQCSFCPSIFTSPKMLKDHLTVHDKPKDRSELIKSNKTNKHTLPCPICSCKFDENSILESHMKSHHENLCPSEIKSTDDLNLPLPCHNEDEPPQSPSPSIKIEIAEHLIIDSEDFDAIEEKSLDNDECQQPVTSASNNIQNESSSSISIQNVVSLSFSSRNKTQSLNRIQNKFLPSNSTQKEKTGENSSSIEYSASRPYECRVCPSKFKIESELNKHLELHYEISVQDLEEIRPYKCNFCPLKFKTHSNLVTHSFISHGESRPYKCHACSSKFKSQNELNKHLELHGEISKEFLCYECLSKFSTLSELVVHAKCHKSKIHQCPICPSKFEWECSLNTHMKIHDKIKQFLS